MHTVADHRRANLEALALEAGSLDKVAAKALCSPIYLSQVRNRTQDAKTGRPREMGTSLARRLESAFSKPEGWMDQHHPSTGEPPAAYRVAQNLSYPEQNTGPTLAATAPVIGLLEMDSKDEFVLRAGPGGQLIGRVPSFAIAHDAFAVQVVGDHLYPVARHGACLVIDPAAACEAGELALVEMTEGHYIVAEMVKQREDSVTLSPVQGGQRVTYAMSEVVRVQAIVSVVAGSQFKPAADAATAA